MQEFAHEYADMYYALPSPLQSAGGCWIVRAGRNRAKPNYLVGPKIIEVHSLHFVLDGKVSLSCAGNTVELEKGDLFCLYPGRPYVYETKSGTKPPLQMVWLALDGEQVPLLIAALGMTARQPYLTQAVDYEVRAVIKQILQQFINEKPEPLHLQSLLYTLFWKLKRENAAVHSDVKKHWVTQVKDYIDLHYTENIHIEHAAKLVGVHRSHLTSTFTQQYALSPMQYLQKQRMERGAQLLKETGLSVTEIALSLGYPELYSFTRAFKRYFGISPKAYRT